MATNGHDEQGTAGGSRGGRLGGASWVALVAATTLGLGGTGQLRAEIKVEDSLAAGAYRLVVQSYPEQSLEGGAVPEAGARPTGSLQREVTADELRRGVPVMVLEVERAARGRSVIVAWIERGVPDLEFGAFRARPGQGVYFGSARSRSRAGAGRAELVLRPIPT